MKGMKGMKGYLITKTCHSNLFLLKTLTTYKKIKLI